MAWARVWLCLGVLGLCSCVDEAPGVGANLAQGLDQAPVITNLEARDEGNGIVTLRVRATDPTNSGLSYVWSVDEGTLLGRTGMTVQWQPPKKPGTYNARVEVGSSRGGKRIATQTFVVGADGVVKEVARSIPTVDPGVGSTLTVGGRPVFATPVPAGEITPVPQPVFGSPLPVPEGAPTGVSPLPTVTPPPAEPGVPLLPATIWKQVDPALMPPNIGNLKALNFSSDNRGWLVGAQKAVLLLTRANADAQPSLVFRNATLPATVNLSQVRFVDDTTGFVAGGNQVFRTRNGGGVWEEIALGLPGTVSISALVVQGAKTVTIADVQGRVYRTQNADAVNAASVFWSEFNTRPGDRPEVWTTRLNAAAGPANDPTLVYFVGDGVYQLDTDAINEQPVWSKLFSLNLASQIGTDGFATVVKVPLPGVIWVATEGGTLLRSFDFGRSWNRLARTAFRNREHNGSPVVTNQFLGPFLPVLGGVRQMAVFDVAGDLNRMAAFVYQSGNVYDSLDGGGQWRGLVSGYFEDVALNQVSSGDFRGWGLGIGNALYRYEPR